MFLQQTPIDYGFDESNGFFVRYRLKAAGENSKQNSEVMAKIICHYLLSAMPASALEELVEVIKDIYDFHASKKINMKIEHMEKKVNSKPIKIVKKSSRPVYPISS